MPKKIFTALIFLFFFFGLLFRLNQLNKQPFYDWDEAIYAQVAKEIIQNHSLKTSFNDHLWLNKPPLSHLLIAFSFLATNYSEFYARLLFALFSLATAFFTFKLGKKLFKDDLVALLSVFFLFGSKIYLERSTILNTDIIVALAWVGYLFYLDSFWKKTFFLVLGVWSKSLVGFYPLFFDFFYQLFQKKLFSKKGLVTFIKQITIQVFLSSLWYFYAYLNFGSYFLKAHFYDQILKRVEKPIELHASELGWRYYFYTLWQDQKILTIFLFLAALIIFYQLIFHQKKRQFKLIFSLLLPLPFFLLLLISKSKIYWYLVFILPFLGLIAAYPIALIKKSFWKIFFGLILMTLLGFTFVKNTYLYQHQPEGYKNAEIIPCLEKIPYKKLAYLVDQNERDRYQFLTQNKLTTETSFVYGGSPAFVYYSQKNPAFYYDPQQFKKEYKNYSVVLVQKEDELNFNFNFDQFEDVCSTKNPLENENWHVYVKKASSQ
jgi:4-amino-4-deoxy-L-arabinose transferase-like glycosyltransferase